MIDDEWVLTAFIEFCLHLYFTTPP